MTAALMNDKIIDSDWSYLNSDQLVRVARVVDSSFGIEGIGINRLSCARSGKLEASETNGHILSVLAGAAVLRSPKLAGPLTITAGTHIYVPPQYAAVFEFSQNTSCIHATADKAQARGENLLLHDERFLHAARFVLTPQYLSRRAFLHRDRTLTSKSGDPIAWFHTTMFDTQGLPRNHDGLEVFKMSYDHQSEINIIYEVRKSAKVRFAHHPYVSAADQVWSKWSELNAQTSYYLNEPASSAVNGLRNRHEICIEPKGYVSLCCMFDPGPTGTETHLPGEYSSYSPVHETLGTPEYATYLEETRELDEMVRTLSMTIALDPGARLEDSSHWPIFETALNHARRAEAEMIGSAGAGRESIIEPWRIRAE